MTLFCNRTKLARCRPLLGTFVQISVWDASEAHANHAIEQAFKDISDIQCLMNVHDPDSELSLLNRCARFRPVLTTWQTAAVIRFSLWLNRASGGVFDVTSGSMKDQSLGNSLNVHCDLDNWVYFDRPVKLDLSGIAKGFAVDQAVATLMRNGISTGIVNAGGDLRLWGDCDEPIWVRHEHRFKRIPAGSQPRMAVATSSTLTHQDGRTQQPVMVEPVTVWAHTCMVADALTKVVAVLKSESEPLLEQLSAVVFTDKIE